MESQTQSKKPVDILILVVISAAAYLLAGALHELVLGLGAFSVNCGFTGLSDLAIRWVVFAGINITAIIHASHQLHRPEIRIGSRGMNTRTNRNIFTARYIHIFLTFHFALTSYYLRFA